MSIFNKPKLKPIKTAYIEMTPSEIKQYPVNKPRKGKGPFSILQFKGKRLK